MRGTRGMRAGVALAMVVGMGIASGVACSGGGDDGGGEGDGGVAEPELRRELLAMMEVDQAERTGEPPERWQDRERTQRLAEIVDEHGWPGHDLVGEDGASAAWVIAQHWDLDVEFQERALGLMREAVEEGQADHSEMAYLEDRVAMNQGRPQRYGTQIGCVDGRAEPGELEDPDRVGEWREEAGLQPLADYLAELEPECAAEAESPGSAG